MDTVVIVVRHKNGRATAGRSTMTSAGSSSIRSHRRGELGRRAWLRIQGARRRCKVAVGGSGDAGRVNNFEVFLVSDLNGPVGREEHFKGKER